MVWRGARGLDHGEVVGFDGWGVKEFERNKINYFTVGPSARDIGTKGTSWGD